MNAYQIAMDILENDPCYKIPNYVVIDELIEPLCKLLTDKGYITLHSCSEHVINKSGNRDNQWNLVFVATETIQNIKNVLKVIKRKYGYNMMLEKGNFERSTRRWNIQYFIDGDFDENRLEQINKNIYLEFNDYFKSK